MKLTPSSGIPHRRHGVATLALIATASALSLTACAPHAPKGQVVAVVNGQEITGRDLAAEARAHGGAAGMPAQALLQGVIGRVLLAQAAHQNKLDRYPGYPSDLARIKEDFLARKMVQTVVKPSPAPTQAQISQMMASQPYKFAQRARLVVRQLKYSGSDAERAVQGLTDLNDIAARLKSLGVTYNDGVHTFDTAQLPDVLAARLLTQPIGSMLVIRQGDAINDVVIQSREAVEIPPAQQQALAAQMVQEQATNKQISAELARLQQQAKISYQPGYAPPKPGAKPAS